MITDQDIPQTLAAKGISPTPQRVAIYAYVVASKMHPTVDAVFGALRADLPTLSRTTVYSTMQLLAEKGLVRALRAEDGEVRYDGWLQVHAHFKCRGCGALIDVPLADGVRPNVPKGFQIEDEQVTYYGLCAACVRSLKLNQANQTKPTKTKKGDKQ